jgi:hypothetical protein
MWKMEGGVHLDKHLSAGSIPLHSVTPLYGFSTDADPLIIIGDEVIVTGACEEHLQVFEADDVFVRHVHLFQPQHLLWKTIYLTQDQVASIVASHQELTVEDNEVTRSDAAKSPAFLTYVLPVVDLLRGLQLFKPGRLVGGDTSFFFRTHQTGCGTLSLSRCSEMSIDYQFVEQFSPRYVLNEAEVPFFLSFFVKFLEVWALARKYPQIDFAISEYAKESGLYGGTLELVVSLEALLVPEEEGIAFRLAQRVANLIGQEATSRKELFGQIRDFYSVRSKIVHGAQFKKKEINALQQLDSLREITRRVLLSILALATEMDLTNGTSALFNDMCLDDDLRRSIQSKAAVLLHC